MDDNLSNNPIRSYPRESEDLKELELGYALEFREVEKAYKLVSSVWDPENFKDPDKKNKAREKISKINEAYRRLKKAATPVVETPKQVRPGWAHALIITSGVICAWGFLLMIGGGRDRYNSFYGTTMPPETFEEYIPVIIFGTSGFVAALLSMFYPKD